MKAYRALALVMLIGMVAACSTPAATPAPPTATPLPLPTRTPAPTVVMALSPLVTAQAERTSGAFLAQELSKLTGLNVMVIVPRNYATVIEAMGQDQVQVSWLPPFAYVVAHDQGYADAALATVQSNTTRRGVQFMVNAEWLAANALSTTTGLTTTVPLSATAEPGSTVTPIASDDLAALRPLAGKKPCWVHRKSTSGYLIPVGILRLADIPTQPGEFVNTNGEVVRALYESPAGETCDFGATFIDARLGVSLPDLNDRVIILYSSAPIIPFENVSYAPSLSQAQRDAFTAALLALAETEAGKRALKDVYDIDGLSRSDDSFYDPFRLYLDAADANPAGLIE